MLQVVNKSIFYSEKALDHFYYKINIFNFVARGRTTIIFFATFLWKPELKL